MGKSKCLGHDPNAPGGIESEMNTRNLNLKGTEFEALLGMNLTEVRKWY